MSTWHPVRDVLSSTVIPTSRPIGNLRRAGAGLFVGNYIGMVVTVLAYNDHLMSGNVLYAGLPLFGLSFLFLAPWIVRPKDGLGVPVVARTLTTSESVESRLTKRSLRVPVVVQPVGGAEPFRSIVTPGGIRRKHAEDPKVGTPLALQRVEPNEGELAAVDGPSVRQEEFVAQFKKQPRKLKSDAPVLPVRRSPFSPKPGWAGGMLASTCLLGIAAALGTIFTVTA